MASNVIPELDITWFKDDKRLKDLKKSGDLAKWKAGVDALDNSFKNLNVIVSTDEFSKKTDWTPDTKLVVLGKFYSEFSTEKQKFMDLVTSITSMLKTKALEELLAHQKRILFGLDKAVELWTTNNAALKWIVKKSELLITKASIVEYGKLEDKQRDILQSQAELKREINALIGQKDRVSKIRQLLQRFTHRLEEHRKLQQQKRQLIKPLLLTLQIEEADERAQEKDLLGWLSYLNEREEQNARDKQSQMVHQNFDLPVASREGEERVQNVETTMILSDNENEDAERVAGQGNAGAIGGTPAADVPTEEPNPNVGAAEVSVVSPQKAFPITEEPKDIMGSARKQLGSIPSSRSSRRRVELEAQIFEEQTEAEIRKKQQEIELKRKQREMELAIAKEELELEEMTRKKQLHLKMKKLEIMERASSGSSICSMDQSETEKAATTKDWLESSRNLFNHSNEDQRQPNLYVKSEEQGTSYDFNDDQEYVSKDPSLPGKQTDVKRKTIKFNPEKMFVPQTISTPAASNSPLKQWQRNQPLATTSFGALPAVMSPMKLPKLVLDKFAGDPLEWPEWSGQFLATVDQAGVPDSVKMNYLKTLVTGRAKSSIDGMGYSGGMYQVAWQTLEQDFGRPELVVNAQLKRIHSYGFIKSHDSVDIIKYSQVVSGCVNVLTQYGYESDIASESVLNSAVRKLPIELKNKWLSHLQRFDPTYKSLRVFSAWLKNIAQVQENIRLQFGNAGDKTKSTTNKDKPKTTSFAASTDSSTKGKPSCPLKDGEHKLWQCELFKNMKLAERYETVKKYNLCFSCLSSGHRIGQCKSNRLCGKNGCGKHHNRLLHSEEKPDSSKMESKGADGEQPNPVAIANSCSGSLQIVALRLSHGNKSCDTLAICDTGSTLSFVDATLKKELQAQGTGLTLNIAGINGTKQMQSEKVKLEITTPTARETVLFHVHPSMFLGNKSYDYHSIKQKYKHLDVLPNAVFDLSKVKVVLGQDNYHLLYPVEYKKGHKNEPWAVRNKLGWTLSGPLPKHEVANVASATSHLASEDSELSVQLKSWFSMESYATRVNVSGRSKDDKRALAQLEQTTKLVDGRYEVGLPWAEDNPRIENNYFSAHSQFCSLERRLEKDLSLKARYRDTIKVDLENEYVRKLDEEELGETKDETQWYVPHHPVINPHKPEKVRRVCNAAAKFRGTSLNDMLLTGPDLLQNLVGIIFRFREHPIALTADIEAMFLQVKVPPQDCKVLRFLWRNNPSDPISVYEYTRHIFGAKSSPTCANFALQRNAKDNEKDHPMAAKIIQRNFYMDDFAKSVETEEEARFVYQDVRETLRLGGFNLLKWICNSEAVCNSIPEKDRSDAVNKTFEAEPHTSSLLGLQWKVEADELEVCRGADKEVPVKITQRAVLSFVASVFDPLGLFAPFTMRMRMLLKTIWAKTGQQWDQEIDIDDQTVFLTWANELNQLPSSPLRRRYFMSQFDKVDLHIFSDASLESMCIVAYIRALTPSGTEVSFVTGKCRIAPMKQQTIPKLELQAALYSVRLRQLIEKEHDIKMDSVTHWTDSMTVLRWLHAAHKKQQVFVANRVGEILDQSTVDEWRHVKGSMNPADIGTRGVTLEQLRESEWLNGPAWLQDEPENWPEQQLVEHEDEQTWTIASRESILDWTRFSQFKRLLNMLVYCRRIKNKRRGPLMPDELNSAELTILQLSQRESYPELYEKLIKSSGKPAKNDLAKLCPFLDKQGTIRLKGRLNKSMLPDETKHPILLSAKHPAIILFLRQAHVDNHHEGTEHVRNILQQQYWITGLRNALRRIKYSCVQCRKAASQPFQPHMADLPKERVQQNVYPFSNTGVDYFGPFEVTFFRKTVKYWCCLFTCLVTRAVHIEVVNGLDTDACMMAITRFMARRGKPLKIISDNGTNFVGAAREFKECFGQWNQDALSEILAKQRVVWQFNPPGAPHFGGIWERLVRSCKKSMIAILGSRRLTLPVLTTTMCLVEQTLNSRPLTPVSDDPEDLEALTPNHFLLGRPAISEPLFPDASRYVNCRKLYRVSQAYHEMIWKRWAHDYLPKWNVRPKWGSNDGRALQVGDLVWVIDESVKRCKNQMARVLDVFPGSDGVVRSAKIQTSNGIFVRPAVKLAPLLDDCFQRENRAGDVGARD